MGIFLEIKKIIGNKNLNYKFVKIKKIINLEKNNSYKEINDFKEKSGIYIFFNKKREVVYVGSAGNSHGLKNRINMQLTPGKGNSNLAFNIAFYNKECANLKNDILKIEKNCLKKILLKYLHCLLVIECSDYKNLEKRLIYNYKPKYNATFDVKKVLKN